MNITWRVIDLSPKIKEHFHIKLILKWDFNIDSNVMINVSMATGRADFMVCSLGHSASNQMSSDAWSLSSSLFSSDWLAEGSSSRYFFMKLCLFCFNLLLQLNDSTQSLSTGALSFHHIYSLTFSVEMYRVM